MSFKSGFTSYMGFAAAKLVVSIARRSIAYRFDKEIGNTLEKVLERKYEERVEYDSKYLVRLPDIDDMWIMNSIFDEVVGKDGAHLEFSPREMIDILDEKKPDWEERLRYLIENLGPFYWFDE